MTIYDWVMVTVLTLIIFSGLKRYLRPIFIAGESRFRGSPASFFVILTNI